MRNANRQLRLKARPEGLAGPENFEETIAPIRQPQEGEALLSTVYLSVDPAMRVWLKEDPGYVPPVEIGDIMRAGGIARVVESRIEGITAGDYVMARLGWQSHPTLRSEGMHKLDLDLGSLEDWIGPLGTTALTAWFGLREIGQIVAGETVLVSGAAGGVGQVAGQIARLEGCRVVGIAGGLEKCGFLTEELRFHDAINYKAVTDLSAAIGEACPDGVDVYFDNVGGPTLDAALGALRHKGRVVICGRISQTASPKLYGVTNTGMLIGKRARMEGFIVSDFQDRYVEARRWLSEKLKSGELKQKLHVLDGLEKAPEGLTMLFEGTSTGKLVVKV
ncbi:MAG: NADP-dependent oxidoreductase [Rhodospirillaceae bacterium]|jgi:NADPH-dependent curcumin reductase CurA|nr:NADP-dependent oxidoreductase [Rhodospirillaceae bacterium]|tara:strand:+ start:442 stop:1443 length:1002 start_codon:yes stop_codon:yes gene_type:complete